MNNFCPKCGTEMKEDSDFCPECGTPLQCCIQKKPKHKLFRSLPFFINTGLFLLITIIMAVINNNLINKRYEYERYTKEFIDFQISRGTASGTGAAALWITIIVTVIGIVLLFVPSNKSENKKARINIITLLLPLAIFVICGIENYKGSLPKDVFEFEKSYVSLYDLEKKKVPSNISEEVCNYHETIVNAYNQLKKDGDTDAFFEAVSSENFPELTEKLNDINRLYDLPEESLEYSRPTVKSFYNVSTKIVGIEKTVDGVMDKANVFLDLFYDKEVFKSPHYNYKDYIGKYKDDNGNELEIKGISFDSDKTRNGRIHFVYKNLPTYNLELDAGKAYFKYQYTQSGKKGYGMIHIIGDDIFINIYDPIRNIVSAHYSFDDKLED